jgi:hypothetical protein
VTDGGDGASPRFPQGERDAKHYRPENNPRESRIRDACVAPENHRDNIIAVFFVQQHPFGENRKNTSHRSGQSGV